MDSNIQWHTLSTDEALERLTAYRNGLSAQEAARRLDEYGPNELRTTVSVSPWSILLGQFKNVLIVILLIATVISAFLGHHLESIAIMVILLFAILLGFIQEYRAERAIEALRNMTAPTARILRDGREVDIPARDVVPGDVVSLATGDKIPADARVILAVNLRIDEAPLTGESEAVDKQSERLADGDSAIGDRTNIAHSGTTITYGRGRAVVFATGVDTEFGKIAGMLRSVEAGRTPLQDNLDRVGRILAIAAAVIVMFIVIAGWIRGAGLLDMFVFGVALAVAVVPEALPAVVTISLAIGLQRMAKRNALIRHLPAVETLGSTSVICSDKTGTLTKDEMTVRRLVVDERVIEVSGTGYEPVGSFHHDGREIQVTDVLQQLLQGAALASDARLIRLDGRWDIHGDPTEGALVVAAAKAGCGQDQLEDAFLRVDEIPFSSERKRMTTLHRTADGHIAYTKGAPEVILTSCSRQLTEHGERSLDAAAAQSIRDTARQMAQSGLRMLAVAVKSGAAIEDAESDMVFVGLIGISDPPRPEARAAIRTCAQAGIKPVMITGDHPQTAQAVAIELGLAQTERAVTGSDIDTMTDADLESQVRDIEIYARVSPQHKLRVVAAWQKLGHIVAMTGDGVNDAPALKKADIGVAMGITGTDVSKEAADMTLADDNFASIVGAVEEGRIIFGNIKKYLMYLLSSNIGEIGLIAIATLAGYPLPLTAVQILYVNLATDGLPALALAVDPPEADLMRRPPRDPRSGVFTRPVVALMLVGGVWSMMVNFVLFSWALGSGRGLEHAMAMTFVSLTLIQFFKAYNFRSDRESVFVQPFANKWLNLAIMWELVLLSLIVYWPTLQQPFGTYAFSVDDWMVVAGFAFTVVPVLEISKWIVRRGSSSSTA